MLRCSLATCCTCIVVHVHTYVGCFQVLAKGRRPIMLSSGSNPVLPPSVDDTLVSVLYESKRQTSVQAKPKPESRATQEGSGVGEVGTLLVLWRYVGTLLVLWRYVRRYITGIVDGT